jgi:putative oxidoreductase
MKRNILLEFATCMNIFLFAYASLSKFFDFQKFVLDINKQPLPKTWTPVLAKGIPAAEIALVILLTIPRTKKWGFILSFVFMLIFTVYTTVILLHGFSYVPCSCGGVIEKLSWPQHLVLNITFLFLSLAGARYSQKKNGPKVCELEPSTNQIP